MKNAEMKVIKFDENDVIATSGLAFYGLGNGVSGDATFGGNPLSDYASDKFYANVSIKTISRGKYQGMQYSASWNVTGQELIDNEENGAAEYNGTYEYHTQYEGNGTAESPYYMYTGWYQITQ